ncbi:hypothetical protein MANES_10G099301v8 [Manihot esculenta]|uniref:Uncharacterized protein n=1 Tax=Manihot esculenta TaxID=3983 RepID=A0ACB7H0D9_MANES|nr:hypothetical protein MANES_10G099301v8 [Manihot esculenta]
MIVSSFFLASEFWRRWNGNPTKISSFLFVTAFSFSSRSVVAYVFKTSRQWKSKVFELMKLHLLFRWCSICFAHLSLDVACSFTVSTVFSSS